LPQRQLNQEVGIFAVPGRKFTFAYDQDAKTTTVLNVRRELVRGVELLEQQGCVCQVAKWKPQQGKGLDDLIANHDPKAYTKAISTAAPADREKQIHYRTEYNAIARQVRVNNPQAPPELRDAEVYLRAIAKGELKDGDRILSQSDQARSLKDPDQVAAYIELVKANALQLRQQQWELEAAQAKQAADRAKYVAIAQQVRADLGDIPALRLDMEVYLRADASGVAAEPILAQGDHAIALNDPAQVQNYIDHLKLEAPRYRQQQEVEAAQAQPALAPANHGEMAQQTSDRAEFAQPLVETTQETALTRDRAEYERFAQQAKEQLGDIPSEQLDIEVFIRASQHRQDSAQLLMHSPHTQSLADHQAMSGYIEQIKVKAPQYEQQKGVEVSAITETVELLLNTYGKQKADGSWEFKGNTLIFRNTQSETIIRESESGNILYHAKEGRLLIYKPTHTLLERLRLFQDMTNPQQEQQRQEHPTTSQHRRRR
jgi:Domain of unknown function (DUF3854)